MKIYKYKDIEYKTESSLRKVIWFKERLALPKMNDDQWKEFGVEVNEIEQVVTEEQMARQVRFQRDRLLAACDYYAMPDYPATEEGLVEVKAYRQSLRDITKQEGFPSDVVWPDKPSVL